MDYCRWRKPLLALHLSATLTKVRRMVSQQDKAPEKVRIKDSYRERIFAESQQLGKSYLETLYFIIDCYFAFKHGAFPVQHALTINPGIPSTSTTSVPPTIDEPTPPPSELISAPDEHSVSETFTLDWDL